MIFFLKNKPDRSIPGYSVCIRDAWFTAQGWQNLPGQWPVGGVPLGAVHLVPSMNKGQVTLSSRRLKYVLAACPQRKRHFEVVLI